MAQHKKEKDSSILLDWHRVHARPLNPVKDDQLLRVETELAQLSVDEALMIRIISLSDTGIPEHLLTKRFWAKSLSRWDPYPTPSQHKKAMVMAEGLVGKRWLRQSGNGYRVFSLSSGEDAPLINRNTERRGMISSLEKNLGVEECLRGFDQNQFPENPSALRPLLLFFLYSDQPVNLDRILSHRKSHYLDRLSRLILTGEVLDSFDRDWFRQKSLSTRILLLETFFTEFFLYGSSVFPLQDLIAEVVADFRKNLPSPYWQEKLGDLIRKIHQLCSKDFRKPIPEITGTTIPDVVGLSLGGLSSLLSGEFQSSETLFNQALKLYKKNLGKRKVQLPVPFHDFHFLEQISNPESDPQKLLRDMEGDSTTSMNSDSETKYLTRHRLWEMLHGIHHPESDRAMDDILLALSPREEDLFTLFFGLLGNASRTATKEATGSNTIISFIEAQRNAGWEIWAILFEELSLLFRISEGDLPVETRLRFLGAFLPLPQWRRTVNLLKKTFGSTKEDSALPQERSQRILWLLVQSGKALQVIPLEQKRVKSGRWGTPREISRKKLEKPDVSFPDATIAEIAPLRIFYSKFIYTYNSDPEQYLPLLNALVDNPLVFWNEPGETPLQISRAHPEIHATRKGNGIEIRMHPERVNGTLPQILEWDPPRKITLLQMTDQERLLSQMIPEALSIPEKESDEVKNLFRVLNRSITIHSDFTGDGTGREELPPDNRIRFLILPVSEGYRVSMKVRPLGDGTTAFLPGSGLATVYGKVEDHPVVARRNLPVERSLRQSLMSSLPSLGEEPPDDLEWLFESPVELLTLLDELQSLPERPVVEWPEGSPVTLRHAKNSSFDIKPVTRPGGFWLEGEVAIDEHSSISLAQMISAYKNRTGRFLPLGDGAFLALSKSLLQQIGDISSHSRIEKEEVHIDTLSAGLLSLTSGDSSMNRNADWKKTVNRFKKAQALEPALPKNLEATLRPYQEEGFQWLSRLAEWGAGACLADDMGLGKTLQILALILARSDKGPSLVVAPASVVGNWMTEANRFTPTLDIISLFDGNRKEVLEKASSRQVILTSYTLLANEIDLLAEIPFEVAVLDEAQSIKNAETQRAQAAFRLNANVRIAASGTPVENHLQELWSLFRFLNPGYLGTKESFREQFILPIEQNRDAATRLRLRKKIQPFLLRRMKNQVLEELPPKTEITLSIDLGPEEMALYETIRQEAIDRVESDPDSGGRNMMLLASLMKLRRAACHPSLVLPESTIPGTKTNAFLELVSELRENNHRALVFSAFVDHLALLKKALQEKCIPFLSLDGSTPQQERSHLVERFQSGEGDIFLISLRAGGTGLNLTGADYVIHMDPWWNPAVEDQATDRAHRIGQDKPVTVYRLVSGKTIEEKILDLHKTKRELADSLLEGSDTSVSLSLEMMMDLLKA